MILPLKLPLRWVSQLAMFWLAEGKWINMGVLFNIGSGFKQCRAGAKLPFLVPVKLGLSLWENIDQPFESFMEVFLSPMVVYPWFWYCQWKWTIFRSGGSPHWAHMIPSSKRRTLALWFPTTPSALIALRRCAWCLGGLATNMSRKRQAQLLIFSESMRFVVVEVRLQAFQIWVLFQASEHICGSGIQNSLELEVLLHWKSPGWGISLLGHTMFCFTSPVHLFRCPRFCWIIHA